MNSTDSTPRARQAYRRVRGGSPPGGGSVFSGAALGADAADEILVGAAEDLHQAVASRVFWTLDHVALGLGGASRAARVVHDGISRAVYAGLGCSARAASQGLRHLDRQGLGPRLDDDPRGRFLLAAVNGLIGDRLLDEESDLAIRLAVRVDGSDVPVEPAALRAAYPEATGALLVFAHGLCESESFWWREREGLEGSYGDRLSAQGWSPVYLRLNTGLPIAENGVAVAGLLADLVASWPTPVERIVLVGHSMGGLVLRSACAVDTGSGQEGTRAVPAWTSLVTDVVTLGTPHLGAPLERVVALAAGLTGRLPEAAPVGRILEYRSRGVLDLRQGLARDVANLPHARYRLVGATLGATPSHAVSETLGDLLVRWPSAIGRSRRGEDMFPGADTLHVPSADHFDLLNHPDVDAALRAWLTPA